MVKIAGYNCVPPTQFITNAGISSYIFKHTMIVFQKRYGHPFSCEDQIWPAVIVKISKYSIANQSYIFKVFSNRRGNIGKFYLTVFAIIAQDKTRYWFRVVPRVHPSRYKQVELTILIIVNSPY